LTTDPLVVKRHRNFLRLELGEFGLCEILNRSVCERQYEVYAFPSVLLEVVKTPAFEAPLAG